MSNPLPLIETAINTEFGDVLASDALFDEQGTVRDLTHVPGFSDMRKEADIQRGKGQTPSPLPVNLRWVRRTTGTGKTTNERTVRVGNKGYTHVKSSDIGKQSWLTDMPAGAVKLADGTLGMGDMVLMVCTQEKAAKNSAARTMRWLEANTGNRDAAFAKAGTRIKGANPEVTTEAGTPQT